MSFVIDFDDDISDGDFEEDMDVVIKPIEVIDIPTSDEPDNETEIVVDTNAQQPDNVIENKPTSNAKTSTNPSSTVWVVAVVLSLVIVAVIFRYVRTVSESSLHLLQSASLAFT
jgi:hypothetical protein